LQTVRKRLSDVGDQRQARRFGPSSRGSGLW
jgi:hypothetical protein